MRKLEYACKWILCALALQLVGCASALTIAQKSVSAAATLGAAAGDLAVTIDAQKEGAIMTQLARDHNVVAAEVARDNWHLQREHVSQALKVYNATVVAAGATAQLAGSKTIDLGSLVSSLTVAYAALRNAFDSFGVSLPSAGL